MALIPAPSSTSSVLKKPHAARYAVKIGLHVLTCTPRFLDHFFLISRSPEIFSTGCWQLVQNQYCCNVPILIDQDVESPASSRCVHCFQSDAFPGKGKNQFSRR